MNFTPKLENIYNKSKKLKLYKDFCYLITKDQTIPYDLLLKALDRYGICILTLNYQDKKSNTFKQIIQNLGILHFHKEKDSFLWDIKVQDKNKMDQPLARSHQDHEFLFHTDCSYEENVPDYFALYVIQADQKKGGNNLIIDVKSLIKSMSNESLKTLQSEPITIKVPQEFFKGIYFIQACILNINHEIRYRREIIVDRFLTTKQINAINELENLIYSLGSCKRLSLKDNQILILSNKRYLHARTQIKDPKRHLQRIRFFLKTSLSF